MQLSDVLPVINEPKPEGDYPTLRDKIRAEKAWRERRYAGFADLVKLAHEAGVKAEADGGDHNDVIAGACGFAWVSLYPGNTSLARWLVKERGWHAHYRSGIRMHVSGYGQNEMRKYTYAAAFASVLRTAGFQSYPGSKLT